MRAQPEEDRVSHQAKTTFLTVCIFSFKKHKTAFDSEAAKTNKQVNS